MSPHDRARLEQRLRTVSDQTGFLTNLFAHAPVGFAVWNADGTPLLTNAAFLAIFGSEPPPDYNVLQDNQLRASGMLALFERAFAGETVHVPTFWFDPRDVTTVEVTEGKRVAVSMTIFPLFKPDGTVDYVAATYKDETELRTVEQRARQTAQVANRELEEFSYSVAHELRAPLRAMAGFASVLREDHGDVLPAEAHGHLDRITAASQRMGELIDGLLALSKIAKHTLVVEPVDLGGLARELVPRLAAGRAAIQWEIASGLVARGDLALLRTVLEQLLGNAVRATASTPQPRIELGSAAGDAFFVRDNGAGFDMAHATQLFQPFKRLHGVSEPAGLGIGLATVQRVIRRHGGRIWADSTPGAGATFYFTLGEQ